MVSRAKVVVCTFSSLRWLANKPTTCRVRNHAPIFVDRQKLSRVVHFQPTQRRREEIERRREETNTARIRSTLYWGVTNVSESATLSPNVPPFVSPPCFVRCCFSYYVYRLYGGVRVDTHGFQPTYKSEGGGGLFLLAAGCRIRMGAGDRYFKFLSKNV